MLYSRSNVALHPFDLTDSARFWGFKDAALAFRVGAVLSGTPGYRELVRAVPSSMAEFASWVGG
jgi:hypothetical protein